MKTQAAFIFGLIILLGGLSCVKEDQNKPITVTADSVEEVSPNGIGTSVLPYIPIVKNRNIQTMVTVSTFAGGGDGTSSDGTGTLASFYFPMSVAIDGAGNIYVADSETGLIRKISPNAVVSTLAGSGVLGFADGQGDSASFFYPSGIAVDASGNVYVGDRGNNRIRKISPEGLVTTFAGNGEHGSVNGPGATASFNGPRGVALDASGNLYVADTFNNLIRKISRDGVVTTVAGSGAQGADDGKGVTASFRMPQDVAVDALGNIYVADTFNNLIRKINRGGVVSTLAGNGNSGAINGKGKAASFFHPYGLGLDALGNIYVADHVNNLIRKVSPQGDVTTLAGSGDYGSENGPGDLASFKQPNDVAVDFFGRIYVADNANNLIRLIETN